MRPGGLMLIGEPYWRRDPPDQATVEACHAIGADQFRPLPDLIEQFGELGCDVVEMVLADWPLGRPIMSGTDGSTSAGESSP